MKKSVFLLLVFYGIIQFSKAQEMPLEIYSSSRYWKSDKTKTGTGFKFGNTIIVKDPYLFTIYKDYITLTINTRKIFYKIDKIEARWIDAVHYSVTTSDGKSFLMVVNFEKINKTTYYSITINGIDKNGKWLSVTTFDLMKIK